MDDTLRQLLAVAPSLVAGLKGHPEGMQAFLQSFQQTQAQMNAQNRTKMLDAQNAQDRAREIERQATADTEHAQDRTRNQALQTLDIAPRLAEVGASADSPENAAAAIDALYQRIAPTMGGVEALGGIRDTAINQATRTITGRQKKQIESFVDAALKTSFVADNPDHDPELTDLPAHVAKIVGKDSARLSELQKFAELPVGKPQGKTRTPPAGGSMEDYIAKKYGDNPTPEQILEARKVYNQVDDRPRVDVHVDGLNPNQEANLAEKLAKNWTDASASTREVNRQFGLMETGLKRFRAGDKNGGSQAVLVTFQKILDPSSVVRESEYARSASGISMLGRLQGYMDKLQSGGAGVPDAELAQMVQTARELKDGMAANTTQQRSRIESMAKKYKIAPEMIFGAEPPPSTAALSGQIIVVAPDGSKHPFETQAQADTFKKLAGIK